MAVMNARHRKMAARILAMLKAEPDYEKIDEIRILNDGGGTGAWHIALKVHGKTIKAVNISMRSVYAEAEHLPPDEYYDTSHDKREFC